MSWTAVLALAAGSYLFKAVGLFVLGPRTTRPLVLQAVRLLPPALLLALIVVQSFADGRELVIDARAGGLGAAVVAAWLKAPFLVVVAVGAAMTAALRAV